MKIFIFYFLFNMYFQFFLKITIINIKIFYFISRKLLKKYLSFFFYFIFLL